MRAGFRAAYEPYDAGRPPEQQPHDVLVDAADGLRQAERPDAEEATVELPAPRPRPLTRPTPSGRLSPGRALAGAALSVGGVVLGIATLLWVTDDPSATSAPGVAEPAAVQVEPAPQPEPEPAPDPDPGPVAVEPVPVEPAPAPVEPPAAAAPPVVVPVTVLNNSRLTGLAARGAEQFRAAGWPVAETGNLRGRLPVSTVYYPPGQEASARAFAERFPGIGRVLPRPAGLPGSGLTVVLTRDFG